MGDRETGVMIGNRQRHRRLAVGLLAELSAMLVGFLRVWDEYIVISDY
jgi:hypothetical protein